MRQQALVPDRMICAARPRSAGLFSTDRHSRQIVCAGWSVPVHGWWSHERSSRSVQRIRDPRGPSRLAQASRAIRKVSAHDTLTFSHVWYVRQVPSGKCSVTTNAITHQHITESKSRRFSNSHYLNLFRVYGRHSNTHVRCPKRDSRPYSSRLR